MALARSLPPAGILLIVVSGLLLGPIQQLAVGLSVPDGSTSALVLVTVTLIGGLLAATINNLPAAAIGAVWLSSADPVTVVAYLVGTNIVCVLTPTWFGGHDAVACRGASAGRADRYTSVPAACLEGRRDHRRGSAGRPRLGPLNRRVRRQLSTRSTRSTMTSGAIGDRPGMR